GGDEFSWLQGDVNLGRREHRQATGRSVWRLRSKVENGFRLSVRLSVFIRGILGSKAAAAVECVYSDFALTVKMFVTDFGTSLIASIIIWVAAGARGGVVEFDLAGEGGWTWASPSWLNLV